MAIFIIEHLDKEIGEWHIIEYGHISEIVQGKVWFTNVKDKDFDKLEGFGKVISDSVKDIKLDNICVLDPESNKTLSPEEASGFDYFVFGGILGDYPPKKRTKEELTKFIKNSEVRNIGKKQMSTDNAVYTVKQIMQGRKLEDLKFKDKISIKINEIESVDLPFRYNLVKGKPLMSDKLVEYIKSNPGF